MPDLRPTTWTELLDTLQENSWNSGLRRFRSPYIFRGQGTSAPLTTSLQRLSAHPREIERHLVRAFRKYAAVNVTPQDQHWSWLTLGQHHGLPTRLLDWSYSPLVALHFATSNEHQYGEDGVVWMLDTARTNAHLPAPLQDLLRREGSSVFTTDMLATLSQERGGDGLSFDAETGWLERYEEGEGPFLLLLEPPSIDQRIVQQAALFALLSNPETHFEDWLSRPPEAARRIIVARELKWEIRDRLDQVSVNERTLFPDLGGLSQWLRRYYQQRPDGGQDEADPPTPEQERNQQR
ncbi:FRG domain-containing protein [Deinococcus sp. Leaf326]|uniref:FRG domain-containing protein n=1 Tax=Deinococcus sp. Leaf326 TaxID=1736338 RepID=UPI0006F55715|nr:FRG domain-containing protein [Deinococcus sp. Leaf326]KQR01069.1 hypothetical protein ASF71_13015 [Deinococcus sp. Leaf326]